MSGVTKLLDDMQNGAPCAACAAEELLPLVYSELRVLAASRLAREIPGQTLQPTALVHEAWLRVANGAFQNRAHFFAAAAEAMRRILVERARAKHRAKRGGGQPHIEADLAQIAAPTADDEELLAVDEALDALAACDPRKADVVKLRYFVGMTFEEIAEALGIARVTAVRDWEFARAWLHRRISANGGTPPA